MAVETSCRVLAACQRLGGFAGPTIALVLPRLEQQFDGSTVHTLAFHDQTQDGVIEQLSQGIFMLFAPHNGLPQRYDASRFDEINWAAPAASSINIKSARNCRRLAEAIVAKNGDLDAESSRNDRISGGDRTA